MQVMSEEIPEGATWCECDIPNEALGDEAAEMESAMRFARVMQEMRQRGVDAVNLPMWETLIHATKTS